MWLPKRVSASKLMRFPTPFGKLPKMYFRAIEKCVSAIERLPIHSGMLPPKLLSSMTNICKLIESVNEQRKFKSPCCLLPNEFLAILSNYSCLICEKEGTTLVHLLSRISKCKTLDIKSEIYPMK